MKADLRTTPSSSRWPWFYHPLCVYIYLLLQTLHQRSDPADRRDVTSPGNSGPLENLKTTNRPLAGTFNVTSVEFETSIT